MRNIIAYMPDMFFGLKIGDIAQRMGYRTTFLQESSELEEKLREFNPDLVIVDTAADGLIWPGLIKTAHAAEHGLYPVIAIGRHTDLDARALALESGAYDFVPNSRFFPNMPKIILQYARKPSSTELEEMGLQSWEPIDLQARPLESEIVLGQRLAKTPDEVPAGPADKSLAPNSELAGND